MTAPAAQLPVVQRQIVLPITKAVEIAYKNIRMRLSRSLLVTSGIVLALAFLTSILATQAITDGMRSWHDGLTTERSAVGDQVTKSGQAVRDLSAQVKSKPVSVDVTKILGSDLASIQKDLGSLPESEETLTPALADPAVRDAMLQWMTVEKTFIARRDAFNDAQNLEQMLTAQGVPVSAEDIEADRLQTRWLLGLALMVAFVGILNAMLMSVTERFREIGTMKCLGALNSFIVKLFLIESLFQGVVGTAFGLIIGLGLSFFSSYWTFGNYILRSLPVERIVLSALVCILVGVGLTVAGAVYPAWQAARMQPIEAMRVET